MTRLHPLFVFAALLALSFSAAAHEGHDHGDEAAVVSQPTAPRFAVRSDALDVVGILQDKALHIYLDRAADNAPITEAKIEVDGAGVQGVASAGADGVFRLPTTLAAPGKYALTLTIEAGDIVDLIPATLEIAAPVADDDHSHFGIRQIAYLLAALAAIGAAFALIRQRRKAS